LHPFSGNVGVGDKPFFRLEQRWGRQPGVVEIENETLARK
jgi:hypothetical protein